MADPTAYPLCWPEGWPRSPLPEVSKFKVTLAGALNNLRDEIRRLGGTGVIISSNVTLGAERPTGAGVAVYFTYEGAQTCIPCDRWSTVQDNVQAIAKTIEALRGIERWGAKHMIKAAFRGYQALPAPGGRSWRAVLGFKDGETVTRAKVLDRFKALARERHPDSPDGSHEQMTDLNTARDRALAELEG